LDSADQQEGGGNFHPTSLAKIELLKLSPQTTLPGIFTNVFL
jgi:hypothetical protein